MRTTATLAASDFVSGLGVNVHMSYTDSAYRKVDAVLSDLAYLGISMVRDAAPNAASKAQTVAHDRMADAGIRFDFLVGAGGKRPLTDSVAAIAGFAQAHNGAVAAVEGPNEPNNFPVLYNGLTGFAGATAFQNALFDTVRGTAALATTDVYSFTVSSVGRPVSGFTASTSHSYPMMGKQPDQIFETMVGRATTSPTTITEFGYSSLASVGPGVTQGVQAKLTLNGIFDAARLGVETTFLYELLDGYADPTGTQYTKHWGLFDAAGKPKQVATALHNLTGILHDDSTSIGTSTLDADVTGLPASGHMMELTKRDGTTDLVLWAEPDIWDNVKHRAITVPVSKVHVELGARYATVTVYDPLQSDHAVRTLHNVSALDVQVRDHPLIIEVDPHALTNVPMHVV